MKLNPITEEIRAHATFSPSSSHGWVHCHGITQANEGLEDVTNDAAEEGTAAHTLLEYCIKTRTDPVRLRGKRIRVKSRNLGEDSFYVVDDEMIDGVQFCMDNLCDFPGTIHTELRVNLNRWLPDQFGTLDLGGVCSDYVTIEDFKYGLVEVDAIENSQLMLYALGFWDEYVKDKYPHIKNFRLRIHQPRLWRGERLKEWWIDLDELLAFGEVARAAYESACKPDAPRSPGKRQCRYCRAAGTDRCPEFMAWALDIVGMTFDDLDSFDEATMPNIKRMTPERRTYILEHQKVFERFFENLKKQVEEDWQNGRPTPGMKMVAGRSSRQWPSEKEGVNFLLTFFEEDFIFERKLMSPAKAEAAGGKKVKSVIDEHIVRKEGKPVLVPESDSRQALTRATEVFDDLDSPDDDDSLFD